MKQILISNSFINIIEFCTIIVMIYKQRTKTCCVIVRNSYGNRKKIPQLNLFQEDTRVFFFTLLQFDSTEIVMTVVKASGIKWNCSQLAIKLSKGND